MNWHPKRQQISHRPYVTCEPFSHSWRPLHPQLTSTCSDLCGLIKLYHAWKKSIALECLCKFLMAFIPFLMNLAREFRIVRLMRSTYDVLIQPPESDPSNLNTSSSPPKTTRPFTRFLHTCAYFRSLYGTSIGCDFLPAPQFCCFYSHYLNSQTVWITARSGEILSGNYFLVCLSKYAMSHGVFILSAFFEYAHAIRGTIAFCRASPSYVSEYSTLGGISA